MNEETRTTVNDTPYIKFAAAIVNDIWRTLRKKGNIQLRSQTGRQKWKCTKNGIVEARYQTHTNEQIKIPLVFWAAIFGTLVEQPNVALLAQLVSTVAARSYFYFANFKLQKLNGSHFGWIFCIYAFSLTQLINDEPNPNLLWYAM